MTPYLIYISVHVLMLLASISSTAISVAFPNIMAHYNASLVTAGWVISIYQLVATGAMVLVGKVSDVMGRKRTFMLCSVLFLLGSLFSALAPNIQLLILARFVQSIGGGGFVPSVTGIIFELFPRSRQKALGFSMSVFQIGGIFGPSLGGWLLTTWGWQSIFWFNLPFGILACIAILFLLKSDPGGKAHIDFMGALYLISALFSFMIGLSQTGHAGSSLAWTVVGLLLLTSLVLIGVFIRHEIKTKEPLIDLEILRRRDFTGSNIYNFLLGACVFGFSSFLPLFAVSVYQMTTIQSSLVLSMRSLGMIVSSVLASFFLIRWGYRRPMLAGSVVICLSLVLTGLEPRGLSWDGIYFSDLLVVSALAFIFGLGLGVASPAYTNACLDLMPSRAATLSGVMGMFRQSGGAISIAVTTLLLQYIGNLALGFNIVFIANGILMLATIPFIYFLPEKAERSQANPGLPH
jgi:EmrB/QacA subfamily drug resistance transporter